MCSRWRSVFSSFIVLSSFITRQISHKVLVITSYRTHSPELQAAAPEHQEAPGPEEQAEGSELVLLLSN